MHSRKIEAYKRELKLSRKQREILVGLMMGDAHMETQNRGRTYRLKIEQSERHAAYVDHLYELFKDWVLTPPRRKDAVSRGHKSVNVAFQTVSHGSFRFYAHQFYREGRKQVPKLIHRWLTPLNLAYWYMDDGSIKSRESKGVILNTHAFYRSEVERLVNALASLFELEAKPRKQKEGYQIYISGHSYERFMDLVESHVIESMRYKLPSPRRTELPKE